MDEPGPSEIAPSSEPKKTFGSRLDSVRRTFCTKKGLLGDYDYKFLFTPQIPFLTKSNGRGPPFFGLNDRMPVVLALILGFQHSLAMLAGIITPPLILSGATGFNLDTITQQYLVSTALVVSGILSMIQITRFHVYKTPYYIGTGLISVAGISFAIIPVATGAAKQMYANGFCPTAADGTKLPCPEGYGAILGTAACCALLEILISFLPPSYLLKAFPPIVTGPTVMLIGISLIESGFQDWAGGAGPCIDRPTTGIFVDCPTIYAPHPLPWGSAQFVGLGFLVFITIILSERFGAPIMKSCSVIVGLLIGCIVAAACNYFDDSGINSAPAASFIWVQTFPLSVYGPLVLPLMAIFIICACEAIGDITATCDVSRIEVEGPIYESRIQGGVLADGINGILSALCTITPMTTFAQNNGVIALTKCANRTAGYCCCFFLIVAGVFAKFAASLVAIPSSVLGGMTTFLFCAVAISGLAIINRGVDFNRRNRFILTAALAIGYGATLVPDWFSYVFTYQGNNHALRGFYDAIILILETGFAVTAAVAMVLNLSLPLELDDDLKAEDADSVESSPERAEDREKGAKMSEV